MSLPRAVFQRLVSIGLVSLFLGCGHHQEHYYQTIADADKDGAVNRGWIPRDQLPKSTHAIHEAHELSPEKEWCSFEFDPADWQKLRNVLAGTDPRPALVLHAQRITQTDSLPPRAKQVPNPHASWWPRVLRGDLDVAKIRSTGLDVYTVERQATQVTTATYLFVVDWARGRGYFYTD